MKVYKLPVSFIDRKIKGVILGHGQKHERNLRIKKHLLLQRRKFNDLCEGVHLSVT